MLVYLQVESTAVLLVTRVDDGEVEGNKCTTYLFLLLDHFPVYGVWFYF